MHARSNSTPRWFFGWLVFATIAWPALAQDDACLACHGDRSLQSASGRSMFVDPARHASSVHGALGCTSCHMTIRDFPHPKRIPRVDCSTCHAEASADVPHSAHGVLGAAACLSCHGPPHEIGRAAETSPQSCATCHADAVQQYQSSIHAQFLAAGDAQSPTCQTCHGPSHRILPARMEHPAAVVRLQPGGLHARPARGAARGGARRRTATPSIRQRPSRHHLIG